ncbi:MAG: nicotinate phosphoribosyltransferase [Candidatus Tectomicrobia bacterium]|nr:nicotinate phosphoribosyltransferase [Candidatus Tectomicrobia bacterium]
MAEATGVRLEDLGLFTDLYQLTMAQSYFEHRQNRLATFSLFIRKYPPNRTFFVAAGLSTVLDYLEHVQFPSSSLDYLRQTGRFSEAFLTYLSTWQFRGEVWALPEGTVFFVNEPVLEVTAPIIDAQLVESFLVNAIHLQTLIATKAARCVQAAQGRRLMDFALRRTHGTDAAMKVARASYLAGFDSTSNVLAGQHYGIPIAGTMAHSYVTCFSDEIEAFRSFAHTFPQQTVLLIDTYDTMTGAKRAAEVGQEMARRGQHLLGVRLDSGDMTALSKTVRRILDAAGLPEVQIVASGGFDEYAIAQAVQDGACIDVFGVGTKMGVAADAPYYDMAYKLVQYDGRPMMKLSSGKVTLVEEKQVWRCTRDARDVEDIIALRHERLDQPALHPLLNSVMRDSRVLQPLPSLEASRAYHAEQMGRLPEHYKTMHNGETYPVRLSAALDRTQQQVEMTLREGATQVK